MAHDTRPIQLADEREAARYEVHRYMTLLPDDPVPRHLVQALLAAWPAPPPGTVTVQQENETLVVDKGNRTIQVNTGNETHEVKGTREVTVTGNETLGQCDCGARITPGDIYGERGGADLGSPRRLAVRLLQYRCPLCGHLGELLVDG